MPGSRTDTVESLMPHLPELVNGIEPQILTRFLKDADGLRSAVLRGFRATAQTVKMPVVRQRLIKEAEKDRVLLEMLGVLWIDSNRALWARVSLSSVKELRNSLDELGAEYGASAVRIAMLLDDRQSVMRLGDKLKAEPMRPSASRPSSPARKVSQREKKAAAPRISAEQLTEENRQLKDKVRQLQGRIRDIERLMEQREHGIHQAQVDSRSLKRQIADQQRQVEKAEKLADRLRRGKEAADERSVARERELKQASKEMEVLRAEAAVKESPAKPAPESASPSWVNVVAAMVKQGDYGAAQAFCETLKKMSPEDLRARLALEHVYGKIGNREARLEECLWIADQLSKRGQLARACAFCCRALELSPENHGAQVQFRRVVEKIKLSDDFVASAVRIVLSRLRVSSPPAFREAHKVIKQLGKQYVPALEGQPKALHVDKVLDLNDGRRAMQISLRQMIEAADTNDVELVEFIRGGLHTLRGSNPGLRCSIIESLEASDRSCVEAIMRGGQPVIVDGSNVAWHESRDKARLQNILDVRRELRSEGYFPVYIYVDAALPYQVDQQSALQNLIDTGAVLAADSRTDADEAITAQARLLSCPVITNDRMADWDPEGEIVKFRFDLDRSGVTIYDR